jgi:hypothetical protein
MLNENTEKHEKNLTNNRGREKKLSFFGTCYNNFYKGMDTVKESIDRTVTVS